MEVSIQANVSSFNLISINIKWLNLSIFVNIILALIVLSSITKKGGDCNEHGTTYAILSDFGVRMTTQSMGPIVLLSEQF